MSSSCSPNSWERRTAGWECTERKESWRKMKSSGGVCVCYSLLQLRGRITKRSSQQQTQKALTCTHKITKNKTPRSSPTVLRGIVKMGGAHHEWESGAKENLHMGLHYFHCVKCLPVHWICTSCKELCVFVIETMFTLDLRFPAPQQRNQKTKDCALRSHWYFKHQIMRCKQTTHCTHWWFISCDRSFITFTTAFYTSLDTLIAWCVVFYPRHSPPTPFEMNPNTHSSRNSFPVHINRRLLQGYKG